MPNVRPAEEFAISEDKSVYEIVGSLNEDNNDKKKTTNLKKLKSRFRSLLFSVLKHGKNKYVVNPDPDITLTVHDGCESANDSKFSLDDIAKTDRTVTIRTGKDGRFGISRYETSISRVRKGSSAYLEGIKKGDQIISINEINVETLYFDIVPDQFKQARETGRIRLVLRHNPDRLKQLKWLRRVGLAIRNRLSKCD